MAVILYSSGVTETFDPKNHTFTDKEILDIFDDVENIRTLRLYEVVNTWCVWGENENQNNNIEGGNFNKLGSDVLQRDIFCPILFIHDTEINPSWKLTDDIIIKGYQDFETDLLKFFDEIAENIIIESQRIRQEQGLEDSLIFLNTIGPTEDKRVMFEFKPKNQNKDFFNANNFAPFANKIFNFLDISYKDDDVFIIFADNKSIILVADEFVKFILDKLIANFTKTEEYEKCNKIKEIFDLWKKNKNLDIKQEDQSNE